MHSWCVLGQVKCSDAAWWGNRNSCSLCRLSIASVEPCWSPLASGEWTTISQRSRALRDARGEARDGITILGGSRQRRRSASLCELCWRYIIIHDVIISYWSIKNISSTHLSIYLFNLSSRHLKKSLYCYICNSSPEDCIISHLGFTACVGGSV